MQEISLEKFTKEDAKFIHENFPTYYRDNSIVNIEKMILNAKPNALFFCIKYYSEKVGIISLSEKQDKKLSWGIMVKKDYQGKGIATKAFNLIKNLAKEQGYSIIISSCSVNNLASIKLHEKCGFKLLETEINQAGNEMNRWEQEI